MGKQPLTELMLRNLGFLKGHAVLALGDLEDSVLPALFQDCQRATLIVDHYVTYRKLAAALSHPASSEPCQHCSYKQVELYFSPLCKVDLQPETYDTLLVMLTKHKQGTRQLLWEAQSTLRAQATILLAGQNAGGGRSADTLLRAAGTPRKEDSARKSTLFSLQPERPFPPCEKLPVLHSSGLELLQHPLVFSAGEVDAGTALLLSALADEDLRGNILDLGCGCGIVGLTLAGRPQISSLTCSDVSAQALYLTAENLRRNQVSKPVTIIASDMLEQTGQYDAICVNPPFHQGLAQDNQATLRMFSQAPQHLNPQGSLYVVGNSFLHYERELQKYFSKVDLLEGNRSYTVLRARP